MCVKCVCGYGSSPIKRSLRREWWEKSEFHSRLQFFQFQTKLHKSIFSFNSFYFLSNKNTSTPHGITRTGYTQPIPSTAVAKILIFSNLLTEISSGVSLFRPFDLFSWNFSLFPVKSFDFYWDFWSGVVGRIMEESRLCQWSVIRSVLAILQWWGFNVTVIIMNKWIFQVWFLIFWYWNYKIFVHELGFSVLM